MPRSERTPAVKSAKSRKSKTVGLKRPKPTPAKSTHVKSTDPKSTAKRGDNRAKQKPAAPERAVRKPASSRQGPIELYYWPTPNGWKISIMLEECGLPYVVRPVDISKGEQFAPDFLAISPNNRMPAIVDPSGPGGEPISVFESGAILQYLGRKTGQFYPSDERTRVAVDEWLFWQMGGLGPMAGQANHFRLYAPEKIAYAVDRYTNEVNRLFGVMNTRLARREFLAGAYSIADMACVGWVRLAGRMGQELAQFPHLERWFETIRARPAVKRAFAIRVEAASAVDLKDPKVRAVLFGQTAR
jgi:GSH-dependent disulfide-bond oxidoreductase